MDDALIAEAIEITRIQTLHFIKSLRLPQHIDFDDLFQEALLRMLKHIGKFDPSKGKLATFLSRYTCGAIIDYLRRTEGYSRNNGITQIVSISPEQGHNLFSEFFINRPDPTIDIEKEYQLNRSIPILVKDALSFLPYRSQVVIIMFYYEGETLSKIGIRFGVGESSASQFRAKAVKQLKNVLSGMGINNTSQLIDL